MTQFCKVSLAIACLLALDSQGQTQPKKAKFYTSIVSTVFQGPKFKGPLLEVKDSAITILSKGEPLSIPSYSIKRIKFKRTGAVGRGAAIGGAVGLVTGLIVGYAGGGSECPPGQFCIYETTAEEEALAAGIVLGGLGATAGVIIGATSGKKIKINGDVKVFRTKIEKLRQYAPPR